MSSASTWAKSKKKKIVTNKGKSSIHDCLVIQTEELEAIQSIYGIFGDFSSLEDDDNLSCFSCVIRPSASLEAVDNKVLCTLTMRLPNGYPLTELPKIEITSVVGLKMNEVKELLSLLQDDSRKRKGTQHMFDLLSLCQDFLVSRNRPSAAIQLSGGTIGIVPRISSVSAVGGGSLYDQMQFEEQRQQRERNEKDNLALKLLDQLKRDAVTRTEAENQLSRLDLNYEAQLREMWIKQQTQTTTTSPLDAGPQQSLDDLEQFLYEPAPEEMRTSKSRYCSDFQEIRVLGTGSFGLVTMCRNRIDGHLYALKRISLANYMNRTPNLQKILREVTALSRLHHQHVLRYFACWIEDTEDHPEVSIGAAPARTLTTSQISLPESSVAAASLNCHHNVPPIVLPSSDIDVREAYHEADDWLENSTSITADFRVNRWQTTVEENQLGVSIHDDDDLFVENTLIASHHRHTEKLPILLSAKPPTDNSNTARETTDSFSDFSATQTDHTGLIHLHDDDISDLSLRLPRSDSRSRRLDLHSFNQSGYSSVSPEDLSIDGGFLIGVDSTTDPVHRAPSPIIEVLEGIPVLASTLLAAPSSAVNTLAIDNFGGAVSVAVSSKTKTPLYLYIQTGYCEKTLQLAIQEEGQRLDHQLIWRRFRQLAEGLAHIHSQGILHRDLKLGNIFLESVTGDIKIGDFGLATFGPRTSVDSLILPDSLFLPSRTTSSGSALSSSLGTVTSGSGVIPRVISSGSITLPSSSVVSMTSDPIHSLNDPSLESDMTTGIGTHFYMSPEQECASGQYDVKTDVYSLGIIFFEMWYTFSSRPERVRILRAFRRSQQFPPGFEQAHPRQVKLIVWMTDRNSVNRPTVAQLLSSDLLPPKIEDDHLKDALRIYSNPSTVFHQRMIDALFRSAFSGNNMASYIAGDSSDVSLDMGESRVHENECRDYVSDLLRSIFQKHRAVTVTTPLLIAGGAVSGGEVSLLDTTGRLMSLRHDLRTGLARQLAHGELSLFRKHSSTRGVQLANYGSIATILEHEDTVLREFNLTRMDIGSVFRSVSSVQREFSQADFDIVHLQTTLCSRESRELRIGKIATAVLETAPMPLLNPIDLGSVCQTAEAILVSRDVLLAHSFYLAQAANEAGLRSAVVAKIRLCHCGIVDAVVNYLSAIVASSSHWPEIRVLLASNNTWTIVRQGLIQFGLSISQIDRIFEIWNIRQVEPILGLSQIKNILTKSEVMHAFSEMKHVFTVLDQMTGCEPQTTTVTSGPVMPAFGLGWAAPGYTIATLPTPAAASVAMSKSVPSNNNAALPGSSNASNTISGPIIGSGGVWHGALQMIFDPFLTLPISVADQFSSGVLWRCETLNGEALAMGGRYDTFLDTQINRVLAVSGSVGSDVAVCQTSAVGLSFAVEKLVALVLRGERELELQGRRLQQQGFGGGGIQASVSINDKRDSKVTRGDGRVGLSDNDNIGDITALSGTMQNMQRERAPVVFVATVGNDSWWERLRLVGEAWNEGLKAHYLTFPGTLSEQFDMAFSTGSNYLVILNTKDRDKVRIKHLERKTEMEIGRRDVAKFFSGLCGKRKY